ncbi:MAG: hypothetical protein LBI72_14850 [Flavobacteriaceae bacterium]|nr:hypothetical protein [Flavobacteriaceae bacterium]
MKKIILFTLCSILTLLYSCKKSDEVDQVVEEKKTLVLIPSLYEVEVGEKVTFKISVNNGAIENAQITLVNGGVLKESTWTATKIGNYKFFASKGGYLNSNEVEIKVIVPTPKDIAKIEFNKDVFTIDDPKLTLHFITWDNNVTKDKKVTKWILEGKNKEQEKSFMMYFETPAEKVGAGELDYEAVWPNESNISNILLTVNYKTSQGIETWSSDTKGLTASYKMIEQVSDNQVRGEFIVNTIKGQEQIFKLHILGNITFSNELQIFERKL